MSETIFERLGGFSTVRRMVSAFYDQVVESPTVKHHFEGVDMRRLVDHQTKFVASLMGGPVSYTDDALRRVHTQMRISDPEFDEVAELLKETLEDFDVPEAEILEIMSALESRRGVIVHVD